MTEAVDGLRCGTINFARITVTGTEDLMMAGVLAKGETVLRNAAREPEVVDLADLLIQMGAKIEGIGTGTLTVQGGKPLHEATHEVIPDRIETGTYAMAAAITGGSIELLGARLELMEAVVGKLAEAGATVEIK